MTVSARASPPRPAATVLAELKALIAPLDRYIAADRTGAGGPAPGKMAASLGVPLGVPAIDRHLPWGGVPRGAVHEITAGDRGAAALGFAAALASRFAGNDGDDGATVVWCRCGRDLYGPGLAAFGLDPARLLIVRPRRERDVFRAMEEALRCQSLVAVLGETDALDPIALRRLQLAAERSAIAAFLLRRPKTPAAPAPAVTRWTVTSLAWPAADRTARHPLPPPAETRWRLSLTHCRSGVPGSWHVRWCDETHRLALAAELRHRPPALAAASLGGILHHAGGAR